ncbi:MAG: N-acetylmuramoyl-L-alanine amidase [Oscillatoria sp. Prado101]|jgi:N-acetylmuramoyl-L-alanine amidase|nr:N-acetylmuramoyl-L-alanine amidase [Oscillatoria sp. Prado101]
MRKIIALSLLLGSVIMSPVRAEQPLFLAYPPADHKTVSDRIFLIGTAPPNGEVLVNGKAIERSPAGHFAPTFPLQLGENEFTLRYENQELKIKVTRESAAPVLPVGLAFAENSLTPAVDIVRMPGELICFGAVAPANATVSVRLSNLTIPLIPQSQAELPANSAVLTGQNQPATSAGEYRGCAAAPAAAGDLGQPQFQLALNGQTKTQAGPGKVSVLSPVPVEIAEVTADAGVARTGPSSDYSRLTPLPKGTQAAITGREGEWVRLDYGAWINQKEVRTFTGGVPPRSLIRGISSREVGDATEVRFPLQVPVPVSVRQGTSTLTLTLHNTTAQTDTIRLDNNPVISRLDWQQVAPGQVEYTFNLKSQQQWGYKLQYEGTTFVLSLRHPPARSSEDQPLAGVRIMLDPGHGSKEDLGAKGPNGYPEKDVTLIVSKLLRDELVKRGATVFMTREGDDDLYPQDRAAIIEKQEPNLALSVHYNALPDSGDAMNTKGVGMFWYHAQAESLAMFLHNYLVDKLGRPSYGVFWNNLALTRPAVAPSVLLELGFMINPFEFEWIVNPQEQEKLAAALADGIVEWVANSR